MSTENRQDAARPESFAEMRRKIQQLEISEDLRKELLSDILNLEEAEAEKVAVLKQEHHAYKLETKNALAVAEKLRRLDAKTGLLLGEYFTSEEVPNFIYHAARERRGGDRRSEWAAIWYTDVNKFKPYNDVLGHRVGDRIIKVQAAVMRDDLRQAICARLGGDENGVLQYGMHNWGDAWHAATRFKDKFRMSNWSEVHPTLGEVSGLRPEVSVGVVAFSLASLREWYKAENPPRSELRRIAASLADDWLHRADLLMLRNKRENTSHVLILGVEFASGKLVEIELKGGMRQSINMVID